MPANADGPASPPERQPGFVESQIGREIPPYERRRRGHNREKAGASALAAGETERRMSRTIAHVLWTFALGAAATALFSASLVAFFPGQSVWRVCWRRAW